MLAKEIEPKRKSRNKEQIMVEIGTIFSREPYSISYYKEGKKQVLHRKPPPKLHPVLPQDIVTILNKKNADWDEGTQVKVIDINPRQPNILQVENDKKQRSFLSYFDTRWQEKKGEKDQVQQDQTEQERDPLGSAYLLWP